jgi:hypothetical protein
MEYRQRAEERKSVRQGIDFSMSYTITARRPPKPVARVQQVCKHGNALDYSRRNYMIDQPETRCQDCLEENMEAINLPNTQHIDAAEHRDDPYGIFFNVLVTEDCEQ